VGNTDPDHRMWQHWVAIYIDANSRGEYYHPTGRPPHESAYSKGVFYYVRVLTVVFLLNNLRIKWMKWYIWSPKSPNRRSLCIYPCLWLALYRGCINFFESAYVNFMSKHCLHWTYNTVRVQEEGSIVCGLHCIFYLIHRCAGHSMTDVTRFLENPISTK
jgi:hypothetical protein